MHITSGSCKSPVVKKKERMAAEGSPERTHHSQHLPRGPFMPPESTESTEGFLYLV